MASTFIPGWYGKIPSLGDFASRRLPDEFIRPWDEWLQEVLSTSRASLGDRWLDCYLTLPIWRFVLLPGLLGRSGWAGVLMPSVDRVGRQFPLTVAVQLPESAAVAHAVFESAIWLSGLEGIALSVLDPTCDVEVFDQSLADHEFSIPAAVEVDSSSKSSLRRLSSVEDFGALAKAEALRAWAGSEGWSGIWWTAGRVDGSALMRTFAALPTPEEFIWLMQARSDGSSGQDENPLMANQSQASSDTELSRILGIEE
jgi:type VI secretion system protein ImpM